MKNIILVTLLLLVSFGYAQQQEYLFDFEPNTPSGVASNWYTFDNNPAAAEVVDNPNLNGTNPSSTKVLKVVVGPSNAFYAGVNNAWDEAVFGTWEIDMGVANNLSLTMDVHKNYVGTVGIKMGTAGQGTTFQITNQNVGNTVVDEWQTLTWDLSGINPNGDLTNISQMVVFVDWTEGLPDRAENSTIHIDNIKFNANKLTDAPPVDSCENGVQDNDETGIDCGGSCNACSTSAAIIIEDFEGTPPQISADNGLGSVSIVSDPETGGTHSEVLKIVTSSTAVQWQNAQVFLQDDYIHLISSNKVVTAEVYSTTAFHMLAKVVDAVGGTLADESATDDYHSGSGWETLTFDFANPKDNTPVAAYIYGRILFFPMWNGNGWNNSAVSTTYVDNITALSSATASLENNNLFDTKVYPNPTSDTWIISTPNNIITSIEVFNLLGKRVVSQVNNSNNIIVSTQGLTNGIYIARITTEQGTKSLKLIKS
ncbi:MAG: T9SS type A sorting domain-containing protein [Flavobacteriaceae bacterium]|nr:T9SS type A sorting domain-containing protein [Flavobacteriaceae bacterium]